MKLNQAVTTVLDDHLETGTPAILAGPPGVGKTEAVVDGAAARGHGAVLMNLTTILPPDLIGLQVMADGATRFAPPFWRREIEETGCETGVLVVDELGAAEPDAIKAAAQLFGERRVGPHRLPDGWIAVGLTNRVEDRAMSRALPAHVYNRVALYDVQPDPEGWTQWARTRGVPTLLIAWATGEGEPFVFAGEVPKTPGPFATPRSLVRAGQVWRAATAREGARVYADGLGEIATIHERLGGFLGSDAAASLIRFAEFGREVPEFDAILEDPGGAPVPANPGALVILSEILISRTLREMDPGRADVLLSALQAYVPRLPAAIRGAVAYGILDAVTDIVKRRQPLPAVSTFRTFASWLSGMAGETVGELAKNRQTL